MSTYIDDIARTWTFLFATANSASSSIAHILHNGGAVVGDRAYENV